MIWKLTTKSYWICVDAMSLEVMICRWKSTLKRLKDIDDNI